MEVLLTKEDVKAFLGLKTVEATDRILKKLGVPRVNFSLAGGKGIRYRKGDIEDAVSKMETIQNSSSVKRKPQKSQPTLFDLPINEQVLILTESGTRQ